MDKTLVVAVLISFIAMVQGHGYMTQPPQRNSAWRYGYGTPADYNDMAGFCGGRSVQHDQNDGKCGVCGEEFNNPNKKIEPGPANEFATGLIFANYTQGQTIDIKVYITAYHMGYFEFRLCENNIPQTGKDASVAVKQECLDRNLLKSPSGETRFPVSLGYTTHKVVLASDVYCTACVVQWRYRTGNSWGCDADVCGLGYGPQEEFVGCSDIAIRPSGATPSPPAETTTSPEAVTTKSTTTSDPVPSTRSSTTLKLITSTIRSTDTPTSTTTKSTAPTSTTTKSTTTKSTTTTSTTPSTTTKPSGAVCKAVGVYSPRFDQWCVNNCNHVPAYCPPSHCACS